MIETRRLKNVVIFIQTVLSFVLSTKIIYVYNTEIWILQGNMDMQYCLAIPFFDKENLFLMC